MRGLAVHGPAAVRLVLAMAIAVAGTLLLTVLWAAHRVTAPLAEDPGDLVQVGVVEGQTISGYLTGARHELDELSDPSAPAAGDTWALVSLDAYAAPARLAGMLQGAAVVQVYARVPVPGIHTQVVRIPVLDLPAGATSGMLDAALVRDQEEAEYLQLARKVEGDGAGAERARRAYSEAAATSAAEAAAYRSGCGCLFAAVIRAAPTGLRQIADRAGVRSVDPAPEIRSLDRAVFTPPLPEDPGTATVDPSVAAPAAVPTGGSGIASRTATPLLSSLGLPVTSDSPGRSLTVSADPPETAPQERSAVTSAPDASAAQNARSTSPAASRASPGR